jgi:transcription antitermination factor NusG
MSEHIQYPDSSGCEQPAVWSGFSEYSNRQEVGECWFALRVKPRHERSSAAALQFKGYEGFVPLYRSRRRWSDRVKELELPLFTGYVFCRFDPRFRVPIISTPGVLRIVGNGRQPAPVADGEIEALKAVVRSGLPAEPWPFIEVGCPVSIEDGPLRGVQGTLLEIKKQERLILSVSLLRRSIAVEVYRDWVKALPSRSREFQLGQERAASAV